MTESIEKNCHKRVQGISNGNVNSVISSSSNNVNTNSDESKSRPPVDSLPTNSFGLKGSGHVAGKAAVQSEEQQEDEDREEDEDKNGPSSKPTEIMSHEELMALKYKKKLITTATEQVKDSSKLYFHKMLSIIPT